MGFNVGDFIFTKMDGGIKVRQIGSATFESVLTDDDWISIITEMSYKPENADQLKKATKFHKGQK